MDSLDKKIQQLTELFKSVKASIQTTKMTGIKMPTQPQQTKVPGIPQQSKKDPVKIAEQIEDADLKTKAVKDAKQVKETLKISKSGQWSL
jgi:hypothetical protein